MTHAHTTPAVIVGIDGSDAAVGAALWAVDEAVRRGAPLRLVSVVKTTHPTPEAYYQDIHHAEAALRAARAAVEATGEPVTIETAVIDGPAAPAMIAESADAALVCVGSTGIGRYARSILGSTATDLAEKAHCPVAVIRPPEGPQDDVNWVVVAATDQADSDAVVEAAMQEAELRRAPVLILGKQGSLDENVWRQRHPDLHIYPITDAADVADFLREHDESVALAVVGQAQAGELAEIVGPHGHHLLHHATASALVVRG